MPIHPSKEQEKRAKFAATDLVDAVENLLELESAVWEDNGLIRETRNTLRQLVRYVRTGESK